MADALRPQYRRCLRRSSTGAPAAVTPANHTRALRRQQLLLPGGGGGALGRGCCCCRRANVRVWMLLLHLLLQQLLLRQLLLHELLLVHVLCVRCCVLVVHVPLRLRLRVGGGRGSSSLLLLLLLMQQLRLLVECVLVPVCVRLCHRVLVRRRRSLRLRRAPCCLPPCVVRLRAVRHQVLLVHRNVVLLPVALLRLRLLPRDVVHAGGRESAAVSAASPVAASATTAAASEPCPSLRLRHVLGCLRLEVRDPLLGQRGGGVDALPGLAPHDGSTWGIGMETEGGLVESSAT